MPGQKNFACNLKRDFKSKAPNRAEYSWLVQGLSFRVYSLSQPNEVHLKKLKLLGIKEYMYLTRLGKAIMFPVKPTNNRKSPDQSEFIWSKTIRT